MTGCRPDHRSKFGFFVFNHALVRPLTYGGPIHFETMHFARLGLPDPAGRAPPCFTASSDLETRAGEISPTVFGFLAFAAGSSVVLASSVARLRFSASIRLTTFGAGA